MAYTWQYYDVVLASIGASMVAGAVVGLLTEVAASLAVVAAALVAVALIGHGLFVNDPVDEPADLTDEVETLN